MALSTTDTRTALAALLARLDDAVGVSPGGGARGLRSVFWGQGAPTEAALPFLAVQILSFRRVEAVDGGNEWEFTIKLRIVFEVSSSGAHTDALNYAAQIDDLLDGWTPQAGIEGGEYLTWSVTLPIPAASAQVSFLEGQLYLRVRTARGSN